MEKILYFQCNDWHPTPEEASKFIDHISGDLFASEDDKYGIDAAKQWIKNNELCVNLDVYDMSCQYWVTCKESWLEMFFQSCYHMPMNCLLTTLYSEMENSI